MSWYLLILLYFCCTFQPSLGNHDEKLPSAASTVAGTVYCDTCSQNEFTKSSHFISGASVSIECSNSGPNFSKQVTTDEHGEFKFQLPFPVSKDVKEIKECSVKLISSNKPDCPVLSSAVSARIYLKGNQQGKQVFSAGSLTFKPVKQPSWCNQKQEPSTLETSNDVSSRKNSNTPTYKTSAILPPNPFFPPPPIIPLPPIPGLTPPPAFPFPFPFPSPPPLIPLPPIPGLTPPPPAFPFPLPPIPFPGLTPPPPPPSLFPPIHLPPIPGLTPPSPPPPSFPFPLPPIHLPPIPGFTPPSPPPPSPPPPAFPFPLPPFPFPFTPPSPPPHSPSTKINSP